MQSQKLFDWLLATALGLVLSIFGPIHFVDGFGSFCNVTTTFVYSSPFCVLSVISFNTKV